jgi:hypothetical protein
MDLRGENMNPDNLDINNLESWLWEAACEIRDLKSAFSFVRPKMGY